MEQGTDVGYTFGHPGSFLSVHDRARAVLMRERPDVQARRLQVKGVERPVGRPNVGRTHEQALWDAEFGTLPF